MGRSRKSNAERQRKKREEQREQKGREAFEWYIGEHGMEALEEAGRDKTEQERALFNISTHVVLANFLSEGKVLGITTLFAKGAVDDGVRDNPKILRLAKILLIDFEAENADPTGRRTATIKELFPKLEGFNPADHLSRYIELNPSPSFYDYDGFDDGDECEDECW